MSNITFLFENYLIDHTILLILSWTYYLYIIFTSFPHVKKYNIFISVSSPSFALWIMWITFLSNLWKLLINYFLFAIIIVPVDNFEKVINIINRFN